MTFVLKALQLGKELAIHGMALEVRCVGDTYLALH